MNQNKRNEQQLAQNAVKLLESGGGDQMRKEDHQDFELGRLLRESAKTDLPPANPELPKQLIEQLEAVEDKQVDVLRTAPLDLQSSSAWNWAFAATLLLAMGAWAMYQKNSQPVKLTGGMGLKYQLDSNLAEDLRTELQSLPKSENNSAQIDPSNPTDGPLVAVEIPSARDGEGRDGVNRVLDVPDGGTVLMGGIKRDAKSRGKDPTSSTAGLEKGWALLSDGVVNSVLSEADSKRWEAKKSLRSFYSEIPRQIAQQKYLGRSTGERYLAYGLFDRARGERGISQRRGGGGGGFGGGGRGGRFQMEGATNTEQYAPIHENKFIGTIGGDARSTFSIDVDTASYANMRRFITSGQMPPRDSIRIEELVNYFKYDYPQPVGNDPFSVNMELASCPWNKNHKILRVGLKGKDIHVDERPATNLVFLLDVSGSMTSEDKLPLLKRGFQMMVNKLTENDRVSIVTYAGNAGVALEPTSGDQTKKINEAIERLTPGGSTHGSAGIELAYKLAQKHFIKNGVNKVILATDGDLNVGITDDDALVKLIKEKASEGVFLTVLGFGTGNLKDAKMEKLADNGNGMYAYIDGIREAHKVLVEQMSGSLVTIAKDVKIQIEFNPVEVQAYRLIGYENRMLATQDFDDDKKDAGEIGAGHTVTALYELVTVDKANEFTNVSPKKLKYQSDHGAQVKENLDANVKLSKAAKSGELLTLALRYKQPDSNTSKRIEFTIKNDEKSFSSASADLRFAASVASFGMLLRGSEHAGESNPAMIQEIATAAMGDDTSGYRAEFVDLVRKAGALCD